MSRQATGRRGSTWVRIGVRLGAAVALFGIGWLLEHAAG
jgi:hypothetical protein